MSSLVLRRVGKPSNPSLYPSKLLLVLVLLPLCPNILMGFGFGKPQRDRDMRARVEYGTSIVILRWHQLEWIFRKHLHRVGRLTVVSPFARLFIE